MNYITIALAKGRLAKTTMKFFNEIGITCPEMEDPNSRKLIFTNEELKLKFFLSKPSDVPTYVEYGAAVSYDDRITDVLSTKGSL